MRKEKKAKLANAGWKVSDAKEFLGLSDADSALVEIRVSLAKALKRRRQARKLSQTALATGIGSSQSRVAKMEAGDPSVTIDLLVRSLLWTGTTNAEIGRVIAGAHSRRSAKAHAA